ncbi:MAG TPA: PA domain-containing protein, partial [Methylomirabilota bacterium]|nr:PA domain-containing protein [Methylomirabilota bacterium]
MGRPLRIALVLAVAATASAAAAADPLPDAAHLLGWVRDLASPAMEGRAAGTPGADRAAAYLAEHFRRIGLRPLGDGGGYLQPFAVLTRVRLDADNRLEVATPGAPPRVFAAGADFLPFTFSDDGEVAGAVVFAGYGITAPPLGYDDYAGLDVRGRVVLVMAGEPQEQNPQGPFRAQDHFHYTELRHKVLNAREHGAAAIVVVENPGRREDAPRPIRGTTPAWGIAAVSATRAVAEALLGPAGPGLAARQAEIDRALAPRS